MRRCLLAIVVGLTVFTSVAATSATPVHLTRAQLTAAALRPSDMPPGWKPVPASFVEQASTPNPTGGACGKPNTASRAEDLGATAAVIVAYESDDYYSQAAYERLYTFPSVAAAKRFMADNNACHTWTANGQTMTRRSSSAPKLGDAATRAELTATNAGGAIAMLQDVVIVRRGVEVIAVGQDRTDGAPISRQVTNGYAKLATDRLDGAIRRAR